MAYFPKNYHFPVQENSYNWEMNTVPAITERTILDRVLAGNLELPPVRFTAIDIQKRAGGRIPEFSVDATWPDGTARFAVETKSLSTPKEFEAATAQAEAYSRITGNYPLVILPFLREEQLRELEARRISGVDLCGNGVIIVPGRLMVFRTGNPNRFSSSAPIKNIYRRNTSMVGRLFLSVASFTSVQGVCAGVNARNPLVGKDERTPMRLGTVSKALKGLEQDLIVDRFEGIRLLQADKLLEKLVENYEPPRQSRRVHLKVDTGGVKLQRWFAERVASCPSSWIVTGLSSVERYAVMGREEILAVYCTKLDEMKNLIGGKEADRFPNVELIETEEEPVYFDPQEYKNLSWASPTQCYLELMAGDKRDQETAEQFKSYLMNGLGGKP